MNHHVTDCRLAETSQFDHDCASAHGKLPCQSGRSVFIALFTSMWLITVCTGMTILIRYENTPGLSANPQVKWPRDSRIPLNTSGATLIVLAHPRCPCTRATLRELEWIMTRCRESIRAFVLFIHPDEVDLAWVHSDLWKQVEAIPAVTAMADAGGYEARVLCAQTSGQTLLYDITGTLRFCGGITASRGHSGGNLGRDRIVELVRGGHNSSAGASDSFVFGCPLFHDCSSDCE